MITRKNTLICAELLGASPDDALVLQAARVLEELEYRLDSPVSDAGAAVEIFQKSQVLPKKLKRSKGNAPTLLGMVQENHPGLDPIPLSLGFAACTYPQHSHKNYDDLPDRLAAFENFLDCYRETGKPIVAFKVMLQEYLTRDEATEEREALTRFFHLADEIMLAMAGIVAPDDLSQYQTEMGTQIISEIKNGAALFLGSVPPKLLASMVENYLGCRDLLRLLRGCPEPPTVPSDPKLEKLKNLSWYIANRFWPSGFHHPSALAEGWASVHAQVFSPFPYYAFQCPFESWWATCLKRYPFDPLSKARSLSSTYLSARAAIQTQTQVSSREETETTGSGSEIEDEFEGLTDESVDPETAVIEGPHPHLASLILLREGYRLCRRTFFSRDRVPGSTARIREALDRLWQEFIEERMKKSTLDGPDLNTIYQRIGDSTGIKANTLSTYFNRLHQRLFAYTLGRYNRLGNASMLSRHRPQDSAGVQLVGDGEMALALASIARAADADNCFFGPFLTFLLLRGEVRLKSDKYSAADLAVEFNIWAQQNFRVQQLRRARLFGPRADSQLSLFIDEVASDPLGKMKDMGTGEAVDFAVVNSFSEEQARALKIIEELAGRRGLQVARGKRKCNGCGLRGKNLGRRRHLFLPIWYLTYIEQLNPLQIREKLVIDREERADADALINFFINCLTC